MENQCGVGGRGSVATCCLKNSLGLRGRGGGGGGGKKKNDSSSAALI